MVYSDAHFKRDIRELERLINGFSTKSTMHGGAEAEHKRRVVTAKSGKRSFRIVSIDGRAVAHSGRYTINENQDPKIAAGRAFRQLCASRGMKNDRCKIKFSIKETTRGSNHRLYSYAGKLQKMKKPRTVKRGGKTYIARYETDLKAVGQKGGWKFYHQ